MMSNIVCLALLFALPGWFPLLVVGVFVWALLQGRRSAAPRRREPAPSLLSFDEDDDDEPICVPKAPAANPAFVAKVVADHADHTAEVLEAIVAGDLEVRVARRLAPGAPVALRPADGGGVSLVIDGVRVGMLDCPEGSRLPALLRSGHRVEAFLEGRDASTLDSPCLDLVSVIAFYKLDGVPPTKVDLRF